ncbi:hypothetical protein [Pseudonocardia sp. HH130630-07]|nr:hypothetical protein [Pseudonocardia sp. HH130630-07]
MRTVRLVARSGFAAGVAALYGQAEGDRPATAVRGAGQPLEAA